MPLSTDISMNSDILLTDVECNEVCVYCHQVFRLASAYLRHSHKDSGDDSSKSTYTAQRRNIIINKVDEELALAESRIKRNQETVELDLNSAPSPKRRLMEAGAASSCLQGIYNANFQHPGSSSTEPIIRADWQSTSVPAESSVEYPTRETVLRNSPSGVPHPEIGEPTAGFDNLDYIAPVNMIINLPPAFHPAWPGWTWNDETRDSTNGCMDSHEVGKQII